MPVVLRFFKKGEKHPPHANGSYAPPGEEGRRQTELNWGDLRAQRKAYPTKEAWEARYREPGGHTLGGSAWIFLWSDVEDWEENEFGTICP